MINFIFKFQAFLNTSKSWNRSQLDKNMNVMIIPHYSRSSQPEFQYVIINSVGNDDFIAVDDVQFKEEVCGPVVEADDSDVVLEAVDRTGEPDGEPPNAKEPPSCIIGSARKPREKKLNIAFASKKNLPR